MTTQAKFLGTSDDVTTCDCCGRANLKNTVALLIGDAADPVYYGVTCAAHALRRPAAEVRKGARDADKAAREAREALALLARRAEWVADQAVLDRWYPHLSGNRFEQAQALYAEGRTFDDVRAAHNEEV